ncbi:late embryogenesis abundant protein-like isoform X2 [Benincasa hispida]|uniref:late embryogenesis abundant protein-like isoform X2 n=1 Tax=Benincasa hispida TaxID=102211 RepID=UPI0019006CD8|nr:late embryogenesis abundant protein-like isoform X2 [Benincasa hispida]
MFISSKFHQPHQLTRVPNIPHVAAAFPHGFCPVYTCEILSLTCKCKIRKPPLYIYIPPSYVLSLFQRSFLCDLSLQSRILSTMANVRDEHGNPVQLTDERGNPVQLTDEFGNPMHLTGVVATSPSKLDSTTTTPAGDDVAQTQLTREAHDGSPRRSSSSSSSSSEDDGQGGRRKKKGLTQKIKEKLTGSGKHKEAGTTGAEHHQSTTVTTSTVEHQEHGKKGVMEKIKERLPGHHH